METKTEGLDNCAEPKRDESEDKFPFPVVSAKRRIRICDLFMVPHGNVVDLTFDGHQPSISLSQFTSKKLASFAKNAFEIGLMLLRNGLLAPPVYVFAIFDVSSTGFFWHSQFSHPVNCDTRVLTILLRFSASSDLSSIVLAQYRAVQGCTSHVLRCFKRNERLEKRLPFNRTSLFSPLVITELSIQGVFSK
jgi:hypothetical protein